MATRLTTDSVVGAAIFTAQVEGFGERTWPPIWQAIVDGPGRGSARWKYEEKRYEARWIVSAGRVAFTVECEGDWFTVADAQAERCKRPRDQRRRR
jgi:hypothetical protein